MVNRQRGAAPLGTPEAREMIKALNRTHGEAARFDEAVAEHLCREGLLRAVRAAGVSANLPESVVYEVTLEGRRALSEMMH